MTPQDAQFAFELFHAKADGRLKVARAKRQRFAYYTTAATAVQILKNPEIWLRSPTCMNDWSEVQHGTRCFEDAWRGEPGRALARALEPLFPGAMDEIAARFDGHGRRSLITDQYIACLSEHEPCDDEYGRLSMWRAYGGTSGVALIFKGDALWQDGEEGMNVYSSAVEYLGDTAFASEIHALADRLLGQQAFLSKLGREETLSSIYHATILGILCVKHPVFSEEREWRLFHNAEYRSALLKYEVEVIGGIAQQVVKLPLTGRAQDGSERDFGSILDRVLIGPTAYPLVTSASISRLLDDLKLDGARLVKHTGVPLRMY